MSRPGVDAAAKVFVMFLYHVGMDVLETVDPHIRRSIETFNAHELEPHM